MTTVNNPPPAMTETYTAFQGQRLLTAGSLAEIARAIRRVEHDDARPLVIFSDASGRPIDLDLRGTDAEVLARLPNAGSGPTQEDAAPAEPRGRGRPKLGVVAREVTLLPRHWDWLNAQPGGASVALRKLVEQARRTGGDADRARMAREAAYHFMSVMAGNLPQFEEAARALFADDRRRMAELIAPWPPDIRDHAVKLAFGDRG
jgi:uncharacterized protein